jgi:NAD+ synthase
MLELQLSEQALHTQAERIVDFIREQVGTTRSIVLGLSGGIDSDVTARLCAQAVGSQRMKCFTVVQEEFEDKYVSNARRLAEDVGVELVELPLAPLPRQIIAIMADADPALDFRPNGLLDVGRSKCALRTIVYSAYVERGYLVAGPSNRTEIELGYYLPFGDGLSHFAPIAHLYKTQVQQLAEHMGTRNEVRMQQPAAGFWIGDSDLEGIAYWLYHGRPIQVELDLDEAQEQEVQAIHKELTFRTIDTALAALSAGQSVEAAGSTSGLSLDTARRIALLRGMARLIKNRPLGSRLM